MKFSLWAATETLVFATKFRAARVKKIPFGRGRQIKVPAKKSSFFAIGSFIVKTVAGRYILVAYY